MHAKAILTNLLFMLTAFVMFAQENHHGDTLIVDKGDSLPVRIFEKVDIEAKFPGGDAAWKKYLEKNLNGAVASENGAPVGSYTVWVQFIVDREGNVTDVAALTDLGYGMEDEVERIIKIGPRWVPASQNGRPVKAYRKQPVTFLIEEDGFEIISRERYVLYAGVDNRIAISIRGVRAAELTATVSQGTVIPLGEGNFIVRPNIPGRVIIHVTNRRGKEIGSASFEVKPTDKLKTPPNTLKG